MGALPEIKIWSALPTPLQADLTVDEDSVARMITASIDGGMTGVFLAGTCGEGPWLQNRERERLVRVAKATAGDRLKIAARVSDNSVPRIADNIEQVAAAGADFAVIAAPATFMNATPDRVVALFVEAVEASPLPVTVYDLGNHRPIVIPTARLGEVYALPNVAMVKDSSGDTERRTAALAARELNPQLQLFNGDEFRCVEYLEAGYNGCMFGGAVAVMPMLRRIVALLASGQPEAAAEVDAEMRRVLFGIYGGESIACWLTGLKQCLVQQGIFTSATSFLEYPLTAECRDFIDGYVAENQR
jgi:dihydrodipicolinate synthase/N-acetylneuraminate lyase